MPLPSLFATTQKPNTMPPPIGSLLVPDRKLYHMPNLQDNIVDPLRGGLSNLRANVVDSRIGDIGRALQTPGVGEPTRAFNLQRAFAPDANRTVLQALAPAEEGISAQAAANVTRLTGADINALPRAGVVGSVKEFGKHPISKLKSLLPGMHGAVASSGLQGGTSMIPGVAHAVPGAGQLASLGMSALDLAGVSPNAQAETQRMQQAQQMQAQAQQRLNQQRSRMHAPIQGTIDSPSAQELYQRKLNVVGPVAAGTALGSTAAGLAGGAAAGAAGGASLGAAIGGIITALSLGAAAPSIPAFAAAGAGIGAGVGAGTGAAAGIAAGVGQAQSAMKGAVTEAARLRAEAIHKGGALDFNRRAPALTTAVQEARRVVETEGAVASEPGQQLLSGSSSIDPEQLKRLLA